jgi:short-subunit dehydrogenase
MTDFAEQYGPWALIAGGAQGIGEAYTRYAAAQGLNVVVIDISREALDTVTADIERQYGVSALAVELDLSRPDLLALVIEAVGDREIGLLIYNAGIADIGPFYKPDSGLDFELAKIAVNVTGPLVLSYHFARPMLARKTGGIILMSSGAGMQGSPYYGHYSATKAYSLTLAESLWGEFKPYNVNVLACVAGMTMSTAAESYAHLDTTDFQSTTELVEETMAALGRKCSLVAGEKNRENRKFMEQLPREQQVEIVGKHAIDSFFDGKVPEQNI